MATDIKGAADRSQILDAPDYLEADCMKPVKSVLTPSSMNLSADQVKLNE